MNRNIFINCPFDEAYLEIFDAIIFAIIHCQCNPRCAMEIDDGSQLRLQKIYDIIKDCDLGIHDISRTKLKKKGLPRFNMPFELGIFMGAKQFGGKRQKSKSCIIMDAVKFRYQEFISDIAGQDIKSHGNNPENAIRNIRNWLNTFPELTPLPGAGMIIDDYNNYMEKKPVILEAFHLEVVKNLLKSYNLFIIILIIANWAIASAVSVCLS